MRTLLALAVAGAVLAGCTTPESPPSPAPAPTPRSAITFVATEYAFSGPDGVAGGLVDVTIQNTGREPHQAALIGIGDHTFEEFMTVQASMAHGGDNMSAPPKPPAWMVHAGGVAAADPGANATATVRLTQGNYVVVCFIPAPDGRPHAAHGMVKPLRVTASTGAPVAPTADVAVRLLDFSFDQAPAAPSAGAHVFRVTNAGQVPHEAVLVRFEGNATVADFLNFSSGQGPPGPPPFHLPAGGASIEAGAEEWFFARLEPGRYAYLCFESQPDGTPHVAKGMVKEFTVA